MAKTPEQEPEIYLSQCGNFDAVMLSEFADEIAGCTPDLEEHERTAVILHLIACESCREEFREMEDFSLLVSSLSEDDRAALTLLGIPHGRA